MKKNYWGYRIDTKAIGFFREELVKDILRQGWGYDEGQDLRILTVDNGARRNLPIYNKVKKGDILLVPRCPNWAEVAIVEATEDFNKGYQFEISEKYGDYGHCFPAKLIKSFDRNNEHVSGQIRSTIKNISRFWNINHCAEDIENLINSTNTDLKSSLSYEKAFSNTVHDSFRESFDEVSFSRALYEAANKKFSNEEWEYSLVEGLKRYFPHPCVVERTGGPEEAYHGTDICVKLPGLLGSQYLIAIQVKDYCGTVGENPIDQISKADSYWENENQKVIEKIVIITQAKKEDNLHLLENKKGVKIIFAEELQELLSSMGKTYLGLTRT